MKILKPYEYTFTLTSLCHDSLGTTNVLKSFYLNQVNIL